MSKGRFLITKQLVNSILYFDQPKKDKKPATLIAEPILCQHKWIYEFSGVLFAIIFLCQNIEKSLLFTNLRYFIHYIIMPGICT